MKIFRLFQSIRTRRTTKRRAPHARRALRLEQCEQRLFMAGDITLANGELFIDGTSDNDHAVVVVEDDEVHVTLEHFDTAGNLIHDHTETFDLADVTSILFWGGAGNDTFANAFVDEDGIAHFNNIPCVAYGHGGYDILVGGSANDYLYGGTEDDWLFGYAGIDHLFGGDGLDMLNGGDGNDFLYGQGGNDELFGETGDDWLAGGPGNDTYLFDSYTTHLIEDANLGNDTIAEYAGEGDDWLDFSDFQHSVTVSLFGSNVQTVAAGYLSLTLVNPAEMENIRGSDQSDVLVGNNRANQLEGRGGDDSLTGLQGNDSYVFGDYAIGWDTVVEYAGQGTDRLNFLGASGGVTVDLSLNSWQTVQSGRLYLKLVNPNEFENVLGTQFEDVIRGNLRNNLLEGAGGNDFLRGRDGNDTLIGDAGNDTLYGDNGVDTLLGGTGDDYLDGGPDHMIDHLYGGLGRDTFVRNHFWEGYWVPEADEFKDFTRGDLIEKRYGTY